MYNSLQIRSILFTFLLIGFLAKPGLAQSQYGKKVIDSQFTDTPLDEMAADGNVATAGKLKPTLIGGAIAGLGASFLRVSFTAVAPGGKQAGIIVQPDNPIQASLLNNITINTYKKVSAFSSQLQESFPMNTLLGLNVALSNTAPTTINFQPSAGKDFDQVEIRVAGVNVGSDIKFFEAFAGVNPLPVQLTAFLGKATSTGVALNWETASERNADYFEVQRAEGLTSEFRSLGQVKCAGNSAQAHAYQFTDATAGLHYYRLRQVDLDGTETFSPVVTVDAGLAGLTAYPTLATHTLNVIAPAGTHLSVFNQQGKQVQVAEIAASQQQQQLDVSGLPGGVYFLRDTATGQVARFVKAGGDR